MDYKINLGQWNEIFAVPASVVEKYIKLASGKALKVLLFLLYNNKISATPEFIAENLAITVDEVEEAMLFWEQVGVIVNFSSEIIVPEIQKPIEIQPEPQPKPIITQPPRATLTPTEIAERINSSDEMKFLFAGAEASLNHLLNHTEHRSLIWIHDYLGLSADVILMLIEYCKVIDKTNVKYIEKVAISWQENNITTHEAADREISRLKERNSLSGKVKNAFGIDRKLSAKEETYIENWAVKRYDIELISYAYEKTIDAINKLSFPYIDKILTGWYENGLTTRTLVDKNFPKKFNKPDSDEHSYDLDKFDKLAVCFTPGTERN